jgi:hypothetical protein
MLILIDTVQVSCMIGASTKEIDMTKVSSHLVIEGDKAQSYEHQASMWLSKANEADEAGKSEKAEKCYGKAQYWLDRANKARGWQ